MIKGKREKTIVSRSKKFIVSMGVGTHMLYTVYVYSMYSIRMVQNLRERHREREKEKKGDKEGESEYIIFIYFLIATFQL